MRIVIADNEPAALNRLSSVLRSLKGKDLDLYQAQNGAEALRLIEDLTPDLAFLDIDMPELSGIEVAFSLADIRTRIVFVTAYDNLAVKAFEAGAVDYILKPYRESRILEALNRCPEKQPSLAAVRNVLPAEKFSLKTGRTYNILRYRDTSAVLAQGDYLEICSGTKKYLGERTLTSMLRQLPEYFIRIHRSSVINMHFLAEVRRQDSKGLSVLLSDYWAHELTVSSSYQKSVLALLEENT